MNIGIFNEILVSSLLLLDFVVGFLSFIFFLFKEYFFFEILVSK